MKYTSKKDIIEISLFITIIIFLIVTAFISQFANTSNSKKVFSMKFPSITEQNIILGTNKLFSNDNLLNNSESSENSENQLNTQNNLPSDISENQTTNSTTTNEGTTANEIKNKSNKWRIEIPKINLNAPIEEGTTQQVMLEAVGHFSDTSKDTGNIGLAAHNRGYECNFFERIKELNSGDIIIYKTAEKTRKYKVVTNTVIKQTNWNYLKATDDNRITLITCEKDKREYRRCIQAIEVL